jgi:hypothetical protein
MHDASLLIDGSARTPSSHRSGCRGSSVHVVCVQGVIGAFGLEALVVCIIRNRIVLLLWFAISAFPVIYHTGMLCSGQDRPLTSIDENRSQSSSIGLLESADQSCTSLSMYAVYAPCMRSFLVPCVCMTRCEASARCLRYLRLCCCAGHPVSSFRYRRRPQCKAVRQKPYVHWSS